MYPMKPVCYVREVRTLSFQKSTFTQLRSRHIGLGCLGD